MIAAFKIQVRYEWEKWLCFFWYVHFLFKLKRVFSCVFHTLNSFKWIQNHLDVPIPEPRLGLDLYHWTQFCACYSCYRSSLREFVLVYVTFNFGIKLLTRCISFSFFKKWREISSSTLACREGGEIRHPLLSSIKDKSVWKKKRFQLM